MQNCLGIYIQDKLIKYARISKENSNFKVDAYGVKFYDSDLEKTIEQIVEETYSYKTPISVNINKENYNYADIFNLMTVRDLEKAIDTEFELFCNNNNKNKNSVEVRTIKAPNLEERDKIRVIYTYVDKTDVVSRMQLLDRYRVNNISPVSIIVPNINRKVVQENCAIVNIEDDTEITTIQNGEIYKVDKLGFGMKNILESISERENSISKAYEICKNTTVYTKMGQNLKIEGNEYLDEIITNLFDIIERVKDIIVKNEVEIGNIYITGTGLIINNIDLLFQESFIDKKCEVLIPYFVEKTNVKINIKDYIEVNSAIALAMQGLDTKEKEKNFSGKGKIIDNIIKGLSNDVKPKKTAKIKQGKNEKTIKEVFKFDFADKLLLRTLAVLVLTSIFYISGTEFLSKKINTKQHEIEGVIAKNKNEIAKVEQYSSLVNSRTQEYNNIIENIEKENNVISQNYLSKNAIPNLLNKIMYNIPTGVQLMSVENAFEKKITITAQAKKYDQLGYFKAVLEEEGILTNITTTKGVKQENLISITITGELPY